MADGSKTESRFDWNLKSGCLEQQQIDDSSRGETEALNAARSVMKPVVMQMHKNLRFVSVYQSCKTFTCMSSVWRLQTFSTWSILQWWKARHPLPAWRRATCSFGTALR